MFSLVHFPSPALHGCVPLFPCVAHYFKSVSETHCCVSRISPCRICLAPVFFGFNERGKKRVYIWACVWLMHCFVNLTDKRRAHPPHHTYASHLREVHHQLDANCHTSYSLALNKQARGKFRNKYNNP